MHFRYKTTSNYINITLGDRKCYVVQTESFTPKLYSPLSIQIPNGKMGHVKEDVVGDEEKEERKQGNSAEGERTRR